MSDLLIKNMEMPTECLECPLKDCENAWDFGYTRPDDCPLVEVKEGKCEQYKISVVFNAA